MMPDSERDAEDLAPCPFCGESSALYDPAAEQVRCMGCGARGAFDIFGIPDLPGDLTAKQLAVYFWEHRAPKVAGDVEDLALRLSRRGGCDNLHCGDSSRCHDCRGCDIRAAAVEIEALREKNAALSELRKVAARNAGAADRARLAAKAECAARVEGLEEALIAHNCGTPGCLCHDLCLAEDARATPNTEADDE